ncbi:hypothetical protein ES708_01146 [subsurface metagenome]
MIHKVVEACNESAIATIFFLLHLSASTPAIGVKNAIGNVYMKIPIDKRVGLPVNTITHQVIAKLTTDDPNIENN